jgi:peptidoglycan/LPS O-acetylase OafA/YrhL
MELKCSFITWMVVIGLSKTRPLYRMTIMTSISLYLFARAHPFPALFIAGATLAELYLRHEESTNSAVETTRQKVKSGILFAIALFLLSYPRKGGPTALGWPLVYKLGSLFVTIESEKTFPSDFFLYIGSILLVYSVSQSRVLLQPIFSTPLAKYLGRISYALYCVHIPILNWIGFRIILFWWTSALGNNVGFVVAYAIISVITIFAADLFWRAVDEPCVRLSRWLENVCLSPACT